MPPRSILLGSEPLTLAPPSAAEAQALRNFSQDTAQLDAFAKMYSRRYALISLNISIADDEVLGFCKYFRDVIDAYLQEFVPDHVKWSEFDYQPHIFYRAMQFIPELRNFVALGFGLPDSNDLSIHDVVPSSDFADTLEEFLHKKFLIECAICLTCELATIPRNVDDLDSDFFRNFHMKKVHPDSYTHTFIAGGLKSDRYLYSFAHQYFMRIEPGHVEEVVNLLKENDIEKIAAKSIETHKWRVDHIGRGSLLVAWKERKRKLSKFAESTFAANFISEKCWLRLGCTNDVFENYKEVEIAIYTRIINNILKKNDTVPDLSDNPLDAQRGVGKLLGATSPILLDKLAQLDKFASKHPGEPVSTLVVELFPSLLREFEERLPLPTTAPEIWPDDRQRVDGKLETPPAFIKRVYGPWEGRGLTKKLIRALDPTLYRSLYGWLQRGNKMPADLDLPTVTEQNDRLVKEALDAYQAGGDADAKSFVAKEAAREAARLQAAMRQRAKT